MLDFEIMIRYGRRWSVRGEISATCQQRAARKAADGLCICIERIRIRPAGSRERWCRYYTPRVKTVLEKI